MGLRAKLKNYVAQNGRNGTAGNRVFPDASGNDVVGLREKAKSVREGNSKTDGNARMEGLRNRINEYRRGTPNINHLRDHIRDIQKDLGGIEEDLAGQEFEKLKYDTLIKCGLYVKNNLDVTDKVDGILKEVCGLYGISRAVMFTEEDGYHVMLKIVDRVQDYTQDDTHLPVVSEESLAVDYLRQKPKPFLVDRDFQALLVPDEQKIINMYDVQSFIPLQDEKRLYGFVTLSETTSRSIWTKEDYAFFHFISVLLTAVLREGELTHPHPAEMSLNTLREVSSLLVAFGAENSAETDPEVYLNTLHEIIGVSKSLLFIVDDRLSNAAVYQKGLDENALSSFEIVQGDRLYYAAQDRDVKVMQNAGDILQKTIPNEDLSRCVSVPLKINGFNAAWLIFEDDFSGPEPGVGDMVRYGQAAPYVQDAGLWLHEQAAHRQYIDKGYSEVIRVLDRRIADLPDANLVTTSLKLSLFEHEQDKKMFKERIAAFVETIKNNLNEDSFVIRVGLEDFVIIDHQQEIKDHKGMIKKIITFWVSQSDELSGLPKIKTVTHNDVNAAELVLLNALQ